MKNRLGIFFSNLFRLFRVFWQLMYGIVRVSSLPEPIVTVFGGARVSGKDPYFHKAHRLGQMLVENGISVLTGGGPGIMEAASCGAIVPKNSKAKIMGIMVSDLGEQPNTCVRDHFELDYFFSRKWLLTRFSQAFVVFPGGFGTLDELSEVLVLIQTNKLSRVPIILFGTEFWQPFMDWLVAEAVKHKTLSMEDIELFVLTDDLDYVLEVIRTQCKKGQQ